MKDQVIPDKQSEAGKKEQVAGMFDQISTHYDFLNHFLSAGIDIKWRKKTIKKLIPLTEHAHILDVATGTGDMAILATDILKPKKITGIDISNGMLDIGRKKIQEKNLENIIDLKSGDSENIPFKDNTFDAVCVAFGVRNFENLEKGISEIYRVLKNNGKMVILEFSQPESFPVKQLYGFYSFKVLPTIGNWVSKNKNAYKYLPESAAKFPSGKKFINILKQEGFKNTECQKLTFGICSIYSGIK